MVSSYTALTIMLSSGGWLQHASLIRFVRGHTAARATRDCTPPSAFTHAAVLSGKAGAALAWYRGAQRPTLALSTILLARRPLTTQ